MQEGQLLEGVKKVDVLTFPNHFEKGQIIVVDAHASMSPAAARQDLWLFDGASLCLTSLAVSPARVTTQRRTPYPSALLAEGSPDVCVNRNPILLTDTSKISTRTHDTHKFSSNLTGNCSSEYIYI